jgi:hypothetical protein
MVVAMPPVPSVSPVPYRQLEQGRITPDEYAKEVRREVQELVRESNPPRRKASPDDERSSS